MIPADGPLRRTRVDRTNGPASLRISHFNRSSDDSAGAPPSTYAGDDTPGALDDGDFDVTALATLSPGEQRVLTEALRGLSVREIAGHLVLTEATVKTHLTHIYSKLGVRGRIDLLARVGPTPAVGARMPTALPAATAGRPSSPKARVFLAPLALAAFAVALLVLAASQSVLDQPTTATLSDVKREITSGAVTRVDIVGASLLATSTSGERLAVTQIDPDTIDTIRILAVERGIPFSVAAAQAPSSLVVIVSVAPYLLVLSAVWLLWARRTDRRRGRTS